MLNKYIAIGNLTSEPKFQEFDSGKRKCTFAIAINIGNETTYVDVECWDRIADNCNKMLYKGCQVFIDGKMKYNSWKTKQGYSKNKLTCCTDFVKIISSKKDKELIQKENITEEDIDKIFDEKPSIPQEDIQMQKDLDEIPW